MKIEKFYLFLLACFVAIGAYSQDGQQKMTGDEKSQQQSDAKVKITGQVFDESGEGIERMLLLKVIPPVELSQIWMVSLF